MLAHELIDALDEVAGGVVGRLVGRLGLSRCVIDEQQTLLAELFAKLGGETAIWADQLRTGFVEQAKLTGGAGGNEAILEFNVRAAQSLLVLAERELARVPGHARQLLDQCADKQSGRGQVALNAQRGDAAGDERHGIVYGSDDQGQRVLDHLVAMHPLAILQCLDDVIGLIQLSLHGHAQHGEMRHLL